MIGTRLAARNCQLIGTPRPGGRALRLFLLAGSLSIPYLRGSAAHGEVQTPSQAQPPAVDRPSADHAFDGSRVTGGGMADAGSLAARASKLAVALAALRQAATTFAFAEPERARSLLLRTRLAPWLPEFRVRIDRRFGRTESLDANATILPSDASAPVGLDTIDDVRYEWRATWDLSRLVFNPDELQAQSEALRMADVRREVEGLVVKLFFERQRLLVRSPSEASAAQVGVLRRLEIEAQLDALTNGLFSRMERNPMDDSGDPR